MPEDDLNRKTILFFFKIQDLWDCELQFLFPLHCLVPWLAFCQWNVNVLWQYWGKRWWRNFGTCTLYSRMEGIICVKKYLFFLPQGCLGSYDKYIDFNSFILVCETLFFINNIFSIYCNLQLLCRGKMQHHLFSFVFLPLVTYLYFLSSDQLHNLTFEFIPPSFLYRYYVRGKK